MNNNIAPMPTQKPMGMGMGTQCRALVDMPRMDTINPTRISRRI